MDTVKVAVLRTVSNLDRAHAGQTTAESLSATSGGFMPATDTAFRVENAFSHAIIADWSRFEGGAATKRSSTAQRL
ncbi:purine nucleoside permease [Paracoccus sp. 12-3]|nr:purine nucleoside permease [Paracoccus xiamenensis]